MGYKNRLTEGESAVLLIALEFASDKHRDQKRRDRAGTPYIHHPIKVAQTLWNPGRIRNVHVLAAAVLHDTIEDTDTTCEELNSLFGSEITELVKEVSDDKTLPKTERKRRQIINAPYKSRGAKLIKLADKICNLDDILHAPPADWSGRRCHEYVTWSADVVSGLRGVNPALEAVYDRIFAMLLKYYE